MPRCADRVSGDCRPRRVLHGVRLGAPAAAPVSPSNRSYWFGFLLNELPFVGFYWLLASTLLALGQRDIASTGRLAGVRSGRPDIARARGHRVAGPAARPLSTRHSATDSVRLAHPHRRRGGPWLRRRLPWARILFAPFFVRRRDVERVANISYGDAGKANLLDVYRSRSQPSRGPTLVYLHGGTFRSGRNDRRPVPSSTASRARDGCASAPTTASVRPRRSPIT